MSTLRFERLHLVIIAAMIASLLFGLWALWQFPNYARQIPPRILPNSNWTTAAAQTAFIDLGWDAEMYMRWRLGLVLVTAVFYIGLGIFVLIRCKRDPFALLFAFCLVLFGIGTSDLPFVLEQWGYWGDRLAYGIAAVSFGLPMLLLFLFPDGHFVPRQMRWVAAIGILFIVYAGFLQTQPTRPPPPHFSVISSLLFLTAVISQVYRYRVVGTAVQRQQTKWVLWAILLNLVYKLMLNLIYINPVVNALDGRGMWYSLLRTTTLTLMTATVPIALTIAILRYRLWDIDIIIRKTLLYGIIIASVIGVYVLVVGYLGSLFQFEGGNIIFSLAAASLVAILFTPLKNRLEQQINHLFYGQRDEPYKVLTQLGQQLQYSLEPGAALSITTETVAHALKLPYTAVYLKQGNAYRPAATYGTQTDDLQRFPLVYGNETIGEFVAGLRSPDEPLTPPDQRLLTDLTHQIAVIAHTAQLTTDLEQARLRIVTERIEARRQLGSDLHDRIGHQLVGLTRQVEKADLQLPPEALDTRHALKKIATKVADVTIDVRHLAHQLYPPELELLGLVEALREHAQTWVGLQVIIDAPLHLTLPTAIETAIYTITLEAITNVEKHANARTCHVHLTQTRDSNRGAMAVVELEIRDDGSGLPADMINGIGLLSMRARAVEVGGTCRFEHNPGGGTAVVVRIPVN